VFNGRVSGENQKGELRMEWGKGKLRKYKVHEGHEEENRKAAKCCTDKRGKEGRGSAEKFDGRREGNVEDFDGRREARGRGKCREI
jgi:hypothetical protein